MNDSRKRSHRHKSTGGAAEGRTSWSSLTHRIARTWSPLNDMQRQFQFCSPALVTPVCVTPVCVTPVLAPLFQPPVLLTLACGTPALAALCLLYLCCPSAPAPALAHLCLLHSCVVHYSCLQKNERPEVLPWGHRLVELRDRVLRPTQLGSHLSSAHTNVCPNQVQRLLWASISSLAWAD